LIDGPGRRLAVEFYDKVVLPVDFIVRRGDTPEVLSSEAVKDGALKELTNEVKITAIGPDTRDSFVTRLAGSEIVFHFGMLGASVDPELKETQAVIEAYGGCGAACYVAGDHILEIARKGGLIASLAGSVTAAQTTTSYMMSGGKLPGLVPFLKIGHGNDGGMRIDS
jgi:3-phosphoglycerate kinase